MPIDIVVDRCIRVSIYLILISLQTFVGSIITSHELALPVKSHYYYFIIIFVCCPNVLRMCYVWQEALHHIKYILCLIVLCRTHCSIRLVDTVLVVCFSCEVMRMKIKF